MSQNIYNKTNIRTNVLRRKKNIKIPDLSNYLHGMSDLWHKRDKDHFQVLFCEGHSAKKKYDTIKLFP
jgi:hypothetical protein